MHANQNDSKHRFNIEGMRKQRFDFPTSKNVLLAAKAAGYIGNQDTYWLLFDKLQEGLFVRSLNIEEPEVIEKLVKRQRLILLYGKKLLLPRLFGRRFKKILR